MSDMFEEVVETRVEFQKRCDDVSIREEDLMDVLFGTRLKNGGSSGSAWLAYQ